LLIKVPIYSTYGKEMIMNIGFIGAGNMGFAMMNSLINAKEYKASEMHVYDVNTHRLKEAEKLGVNIASDITELVQKSELIVLAVKPNVMKSVIEDIKDEVENKILISIAVGVPIEFFMHIIGDKCKIIRAMPNTPALVGEGMTLISYCENILEDEVVLIKKIFSSMGKVEELDEKLMSEVTAVTGSSPAYVFMFIEAMADAAVMSGIPRGLAYKLASQAVLGSAKMVLETGNHPAVLKDQVCSPAGTTIEAVKILEKNGFRNAVIEAMEACTKRALEIGKKFYESK
jgi:pyrroline-5-carboxylate reductase